MTKSSQISTPHEQDMFHPWPGRLAQSRFGSRFLTAGNAGSGKPRGRFWPARKKSLGSWPWSVMRQAVGHDRYGAILNGRCDVGFANRDPVDLAQCGHSILKVFFHAVARLAVSVSTRVSDCRPVLGQVKERGAIDPPSEAASRGGGSPRLACHMPPIRQWWASK
jgi:hypothetical protein